MGRDDPLVPPLTHPHQASGLPLRIGYFDDDGLVRPARAIIAGLERARAALLAAGHDVVEFPLKNQRELIELYVAVLGADRLRTVGLGLRGERPVPPFRTMWRVGRLPAFARRIGAWVLDRMGEKRIGRMAWVAGERRVDELYALAAQRAEMRRDELQRWNELGLDALLCPATTTAAVPVGLSHDFALTFGYTGRFNVLGFPAGVVPVGVATAKDAAPDRSPQDRIDKRINAISARSIGLPLAVQVVGRPFREDTVLDLMGTIEAASIEAGHSVPWPAT